MLFFDDMMFEWIVWYVVVCDFEGGEVVVLLLVLVDSEGEVGDWLEIEVQVCELVVCDGVEVVFVWFDVLFGMKIGCYCFLQWFVMVCVVDYVG